MGHGGHKVRREVQPPLEIFVVLPTSPKGAQPGPIDELLWGDRMWGNWPHWDVGPEPGALTDRAAKIF